MAAVCAAAAIAGARETGAAESLLGEWWTPGFAARVRFEHCGTLLCGRIVWLWDESAPPDTRALLGRRVVRDMRPSGAGLYDGGALDNPEDGREYRGSLQIEGNRLVVRGCVLLFCRTQVWRRYAPARIPPVV